MVSTKEEILKKVEHKQTITRVLDKIEQAIKNWELVTTDFLSPPELIEINEIFKNLTEIKFITWGGYPQAERNILAIHREEIYNEKTEIPLVALDIAGNFLFDSATHRDFLGAILGTGIVRDKVGDIIVLGERGAQVIVLSEIADFIQNNLVQVRTVPVKVNLIELTDLKIREPKKQELTTVEASLRLDAIASFGFKISRSKMVEAINNNDIRVNWKEITQPSYNLKTGDLVSFRGKGRLEIGEIQVTKKERYRINLIKFV